MKSKSRGNADGRRVRSLFEQLGFRSPCGLFTERRLASLTRIPLGVWTKNFWFTGRGQRPGQTLDDKGIFLLVSFFSPPILEVSAVHHTPLASSAL